VANVGDPVARVVVDVDAELKHVGHVEPAEFVEVETGLLAAERATAAASAKRPARSSGSIRAGSRSAFRRASSNRRVRIASNWAS
jgi:hypothetical protein